MYDIVWYYLELIRFSHTLFALPFALLSAAMALKLNWVQESPVSFRSADGIGILLCMIFARSAAMGFNRWADRKIDATNPRTATRHIPSGVLCANHVLLFVGLCALGFILSTLLFLPNTIPAFASLPVLAFLLGYSYAKRWTVATHFWLGAALMLAPMAAWAVVRPVLYPVPWPPILLGLAVLFWSAGFDLIYACQDAKIDAETGVFSIPGRYGIRFALRIASLSHILSLLFFAAIPFTFRPFGLIFHCGVSLVALILLAEHRLAVPRKGEPIDLVKINIAFFQMNILISIGLLLVGLIDLFVAGP